MGVDVGLGDAEASRHVPHSIETRNPPALRRRRIHGPVVRGTAARMYHVVSAAENGSAIPLAVDVGVERRANADRRVKAPEYMPGPGAAGADRLRFRPGSGDCERAAAAR